MNIGNFIQRKEGNATVYIIIERYELKNRLGSVITFKAQEGNNSFTYGLDEVKRYYKVVPKITAVLNGWEIT